MDKEPTNIPRKIEHFIGEDAERAYADIFRAGAPVGGFEDNGLDIPTGDSIIPFVQIKSSLKGAMAFMKESARRNHFIPVCIGEPGEKEEMLDSLKEFGAWIAKDIPDRNILLQQIKVFKDTIDRRLAA